MQLRTWYGGIEAGRVRPYIATLFLVVLFALAQYAGSPVFGYRAPLGLMFIPVMIRAVFGGWRQAVFASMLSLLIAPLLLLEPELSFHVSNPEDRGAFLVFALVCFFTSVMGGLLEHSERNADAFLTSLQESEQTFRAFLEASTHAALGIGADGKIRFASKSVYRQFGYRPSEIIGQSFELLVLTGLRRLRGPELGGLFSGAPSDPPGEVEELQCRRKNGTLFPAEASLGMVDVPSGRLAVSFIADVSQRKEAEERILHAARHDHLTGLPNRALVYELGSHLLHSARRHHSEVAVLFFDLDRFKPINDTYGHTAGDRMLQEVARRLRTALRGNDIVGRLGGDEFVAILSDIPNEDAIQHSASHLLHTLSQPYHIDSLELRTSPSIGISIYPNDGNDIDTLIRHADAAMYHAKNNGRNTYQFFTHEINLHARQAYELEQRLRYSVNRDEFELRYQPILDLHSRNLVGVEALVRWRQDSQWISPDQFIRAAERSGIINQLGDWVLHEACRQHERWRHLGLPPIRIAVNVSPIQFRAKNFHRRVADIIDDCGLNPAFIELELTESTVMSDVEDAAKMLDSLKQQGMRIALDDFGTGYSSLSYLSQFPIDKLKIDQSFIKNIETDARSSAIAETVITLGKKLGVEVVAEGIESQAALKLLAQLGCHLGQGYFISKPVSADRLVEWYYHNDYKQLLF